MSLPLHVFQHEILKPLTEMITKVLIVIGIASIVYILVKIAMLF